MMDTLWTQTVHTDTKQFREVAVFLHYLDALLEPKAWFRE